MFWVHTIAHLLLLLILVSYTLLMTWSFNAKVKNNSLSYVDDESKYNGDIKEAIYIKRTGWLFILVAACASFGFVKTYGPGNIDAYFMALYTGALSSGMLILASFPKSLVKRLLKGRLSNEMLRKFPHLSFKRESLICKSKFLSQDINKSRVWLSWLYKNFDLTQDGFETRRKLYNISKKIKAKNWEKLGYLMKRIEEDIVLEKINQEQAFKILEMFHSKKPYSSIKILTTGTSGATQSAGGKIVRQYEEA